MSLTRGTRVQDLNILACSHSLSSAFLWYKSGWSIHTVWTGWRYLEIHQPRHLWYFANLVFCTKIFSWVLTSRRRLTQRLFCKIWRFAKSQKCLTWWVSKYHRNILHIVQIALGPTFMPKLERRSLDTRGYLLLHRWLDTGMEKGSAFVGISLGFLDGWK